MYNPLYMQPGAYPPMNGMMPGAMPGMPGMAPLGGMPAMGGMPGTMPMMMSPGGALMDLGYDYIPPQLSYRPERHMSPWDLATHHYSGNRLERTFLESLLNTFSEMSDGHLSERAAKKSHRRVYKDNDGADAGNRTLGGAAAYQAFLIWDRDHFTVYHQNPSDENRNRLIGIAVGELHRLWDVVCPRSSRADIQIAGKYAAATARHIFNRHYNLSHGNNMYGYPSMQGQAQYTNRRDGDSDSGSSTHSNRSRTRRRRSNDYVAGGGYGGQGYYGYPQSYGGMPMSAGGMGSMSMAGGVGGMPMAGGVMPGMAMGAGMPMAGTMPMAGAMGGVGMGGMPMAGGMGAMGGMGMPVVPGMGVGALPMDPMYQSTYGAYPPGYQYGRYY